MDIDIKHLKDINKETFKKEVRKKITQAAFQYLLDKTKRHSKMMSLKYDKLSMQNYLKSKNISKFQAQKLFKFRTYMEDFRENFRNGNENLVCRSCLNVDQLDSQSHFLNCSTINFEIPETKNKNINNIFSEDVQINKNIVQILIKALKKRNDLMYIT